MRLLTFVIVAGLVSGAHGRGRAQEPRDAPGETAAASSDVDLSRERAWVDESNAARAASEPAAARAAVAQAVRALVARPESERSADWLALLSEAGRAAADARDARTARDAWQRVHDVRARTLPDDHPDLLAVRLNLSAVLHELGDVAGARILEERVCETAERTLPPDHPRLAAALGNFATTLQSLGEFEQAKVLEERVLDVFVRTLPADDVRIQMARGNLAVTLQSLGDLEGARALQEASLAAFERTLPDDHPDVQRARLNLAGTIEWLGDVAAARALKERVLEISSRSLPDDHPELQRARLALAETLRAAGDLDSARVLLEKALEMNARTLPPDHPELSRARQSLASTLKELGDFAGARSLEEAVLEARERTLPDSHPHVHLARSNLAVTLEALGELSGARELQERTLEWRARTLPDDHPELQRARWNVARVLAKDLAREAGARARDAEARARDAETGTRDADARDRNSASPSSPADSAPLGDAGAPPSSDTGRERVRDLVVDWCRAQVRAARSALERCARREAEERCASLSSAVDLSLSLALGYGVFEPLRELESPAFALLETTRGGAIASAELARRGRGDPRYANLHAALRSATDELAAVARRGAESESFSRAWSARDSAERALIELGGEHSVGRPAIDDAALAQRLGARSVAICWRRFEKQGVALDVDPSGARSVRETSVTSLCAFVVRGAAGDPRDDATRTTLVDLGPLAPIEAEVSAWRESLGVALESRGAPARDDVTRAEEASHARGLALRERILDPLLPAIGEAERIVLVPDDVLHLVPLDALPLADGSLAGERWKLETRATTAELLDPAAPASSAQALVAFGDVDYAAAADGSAPFASLASTASELRGIAQRFADRFGREAPAEIRARADATRASLVDLAPRARFLHVATHGWYATDSIRSWSDPEPLDGLSGSAWRASGTEQVRATSPLLLCGLAFAGANRSHETDPAERTPALVTAEELSTLDLWTCELAVLSACDTSVGERRAGQGVASLQRALQMAGARSVITSLWKVPDEATKELMLDFYRRLWVEKKPKHQALWEAKTKLREAKDERGEPKYSTRDWAAWVLTGAQD